MQENVIPVITPIEIDKVIDSFCKNISTENVPAYVDVVLYGKGVAGKCFHNVDNYIGEFGGKRVIGWNICRCKNIFLQAESHAIVEKDNGKLLDVSPQDGKEKILFLRDCSLQELAHPIESKYLKLTDSSLTQEFVELREEIERMQFSSEDGFYLSEDILNKYTYYMMKFSEPRGKNEFCSCGSNLKYKNCCGKYE